MYVITYCYLVFNNLSNNRKCFNQEKGHPEVLVVISIELCDRGPTLSFCQFYVLHLCYGPSQLQNSEPVTKLAVSGSTVGCQPMFLCPQAHPFI